MDAVQIDLREEDLRNSDQLKRLRLRVEEFIPCGTGKAHESPLPSSIKKEELWDRVKEAEKGKCSIEKAKRQIGTLGSGNHFIEVCTDTEGWIWLMLHSGSRNFGKEVADTHARKTQTFEHNKGVPISLGAFLQGTPEFDAYWRDMQTAQLYAKLNRELMMELLETAFYAEGFKISRRSPYISCHHNYATEEEHFGEKLIVSRKGVISARAGEKGIIPGARGRKSFIVEGLGNSEALFSASHGAGRRMSRGDANRKYTLEDLERSSRGIECYIGKGVLDEIAEAYKDIEIVMTYQADLVKPITELRALINIKGHDDKTKKDRRETEKVSDLFFYLFNSNQ
jgi:tRNA-splicing ligase RtcB